MIGRSTFVIGWGWYMDSRRRCMVGWSRFVVGWSRFVMNWSWFVINWSWGWIWSLSWWVIGWWRGMEELGLGIIEDRGIVRLAKGK